ncbi:protein-tyrosine phosphatase-like protein [Crucibulum laeve]|uniref:Protein-tyrosine phosphatase-like protein n=1 Tax=Crucibulum laeve TaxID=68775 RepID=A0A5C3MC32_9AGAR|nr:protein-tyrosine phosphatase-like protein [Crucibulum laeve]
MSSSLPPPFVSVEGLFNTRAVGGYTLTSGQKVKPAVLYRSGEITRITPRGEEELLKLGVRKIFDLRADGEIATFNTPSPGIDGVEIRHTPISRLAKFGPDRIVSLLKQFQENELGTFLTENKDVLEIAGPALNEILTHIRDHPESPCLIHCTAGKDRTGLVVAIILMMLGVDDRDIIADYALTTIGLEPVIPIFVARLSKVKEYLDNEEGTRNMGSSKPEIMAATLKMIREEFGSAETYIKGYTSISEAEISAIKQNLLVQ